MPDDNTPGPDDEPCPEDEHPFFRASQAAYTCAWRVLKSAQDEGRETDLGSEAARIAIDRVKPYFAGDEHPDTPQVAAVAVALVKLVAARMHRERLEAEIAAEIAAEKAASGAPEE